ncbi:MAG: acyl dehydratase [Rhodocyclales bacterium]|nr:acyl dehydratase [Rhodocyclales bacterium]
MKPEIRLDYRARPSALAFMARALRPSPGLKRGVPAIAARWRHRVAPAELARFNALSGLPGSETLPLLYPHTIAFPLHMAILTQPAFPVPIWTVLQVRNRIQQHAPLARDATLDITVQVAGHRILEKGAEFDLHATVGDGTTIAWESVNTFYVRGRFGAPTAQAVPEAQKVSLPETASWHMPAGGGWHYGGLSGDYNPLHLWSGYARKHGFAQAFFHPQRVLGHCLARLPQVDSSLPLRLEAWLKGPVFYGAPVKLRSETGPDGTRFALHVNEDERPAIVGLLNTERG